MCGKVLLSTCEFPFFRFDVHVTPAMFIPYIYSDGF